MILRKALGDLFARKLRTGLVVLSVAVAVFGVSSIKILGAQFERSAAEKFASSNPPDLTVDTVAMPAAKRDQLRELDNVRAVEGRLVGTARWKPKGGDRKENIAIQGIVDFQSDNTLDRVRVVRGNLPGLGEVLFEKDSRQKYDLSIGQQITLIGTDGEHTYTISGFGENPSVASAAVVGFASAWLNREDAERILKLGGDNRVLVRMQDNTTASLREDTQQRVREALEGAEITVITSQVRDSTALPGKDMLDALHTILLAFGLLGAFASGLLVINTVSTIVLEQRPQIGAMKAIGGTTSHVMAMYIVLSLLYGVLGTALGLLGGIGLNALAAGARAAALDEAPTALALGLDSVGLAAGIGIGSCLVAALVPSWLGSRVTIREAMVSYGLSADFGGSLWDRLVARLTALAPAGMLASRNVFRQTPRALSTVLGLAIVTALVLAVLAALVSLFLSLDASGKALKADLIIAFDAPAESSTIHTALENAAGIERSELWLVSSAKAEGKSLTVTGLPPDADIFDKSTVRSGGTWLEEGKTDQAVITQRLASRRNLQVGSQITLESGSRPASQWMIVGIVPGAGPDALAPDGAVYAPYEAVRTLVDFPDSRGNQLYVRLSDRGQANVDAQANAITDALADAGLSNTPVKLYEQQENNQRIFAGFVLLFSLMILIVSVVGALGLFSTLTMNVLEHRKEIGVMRSIGAPTGTILWTFLLEGLLLGILGWALGVVLGGPAGRLLVGFISDKLIPMEYVFPPEGVIVTLGAVLVVAFASSIGPSLLAARMRIADILRYA